jgi:hypothetical protein
VKYWKHLCNLHICHQSTNSDVLQNPQIAKFRGILKCLSWPPCLWSPCFREVETTKYPLPFKFGDFPALMTRLISYLLSHYIYTHYIHYIYIVIHYIYIIAHSYSTTIPSWWYCHEIYFQSLFSHRASQDGTVTRQNRRRCWIIWSRLQACPGPVGISKGLGKKTIWQPEMTCRNWRWWCSIAIWVRTEVLGKPFL